MAALTPMVRRDPELLLRHPALSMRLEHFGQPAAQDHLDRAVARRRQPACRRLATGRHRRTPHSRARHANRQSQRPPTAVAGPGLATRPHAVQLTQMPQDFPAQSPAGAQGLMQLMPGTQRDLGVANAFDPRQNVDAGVAYLRRLTDKFGTVLAIAAYNARPGAVRRYNGIPPYAETRAYVRAVLDRSRPVCRREGNRGT